ncbi:39S ribosomal protein L22, mitochondrial [Tupaia chinensis]|uniref:Large ribosomal subunit protein uL22m n=1 Tax=Tupaia chinensis TaxID=246437 RepID=L8Y7S0_TUPCH|nr:39S ribosomal protein L22, mitochondrial [Tupaia chinensis]
MPHCGALRMRVAERRLNWEASVEGGGGKDGGRGTGTISVLPASCLHTSAALDMSGKWEKKNKIVYPPQLPGEPRRPAVLLEAQDMAVRDHNVEFRSNLYIAESTSGRGQYLKRIRYHGRGRFGIMEKVYCHYFVKLVEGPPPPPEAPKTAVARAQEYIGELRSRTIIHAL